MDNLTYNAEDVARMLNKAKKTAYKIIRNINLSYCKEKKLNIKVMGSGRVSKELFHKYYPEAQKI